MLLNNRMASIPCSNRHSVSYLKDLQILFQDESQCSTDSSTQTAALQYFHMRVTHRLHQYRSLKRQWQELASSNQNHSFQPHFIQQVSVNHREVETTNQENEIRPIEPFIRISNKLTTYPSYESLATATPRIGSELQQKETIELDPLHTKIQHDLVKLRRLIKKKQSKSFFHPPQKSSTEKKPFDDNVPSKSSSEDPENLKNSSVRKSTSLKVLKPLDRVKIAGLPVRRPSILQTETVDNGLVNTSNASSTCSQYPKLNHNNIKSGKSIESKKNRSDDVSPEQPTRLENVSPSSSVEQASSPNTHSAKTLPKMNSRNNLQYRLPLAQISSKTSRVVTSNPVKQENILPPIRSVTNHEISASSNYTYAAPSSSVLPSSMITPRDESVLPILLYSTCCIGSPAQKSSRQTEENSDTPDDEIEPHRRDEQIDSDYHYLREYQRLVDRLPSPIIPFDQFHQNDDFQILFEQLNHVRKTMPTATVYKNFARNV